jgi:hypothetical protein
MLSILHQQKTKTGVVLMSMVIMASYSIFIVVFFLAIFYVVGLCIYEGIRVLFKRKDK